MVSKLSSMVRGAVNDGSIHSVVLLLGELVELAGLHGQANAVLGSAQLGLLAGVSLGELPAIVQESVRASFTDSARPFMAEVITVSYRPDWSTSTPIILPPLA